jgi:stage II sporulation protein D
MKVLRGATVPDKLTIMVLRRLKLGLWVLALYGSTVFALDRVRISVFGLFHPQLVTVEAGRLLVVKALGRELVLEPGQRIALRVAGAQVEIGDGEAAFAAKRVEISSRDGAEPEFTLAIPGKIRRAYRGQLAVVVRGSDLVPVVSMELETVVASVNGAEAIPGAPIEALKAQAVAIRSYLVAGGPRHPFSDFCDTTHCQFLKAPPGANTPAARATEATRGMVLAWQGRPFAAMYSASCAGRMHSLAEIGYAQRDYPYFAVECAYCRRHPDRWSATISEADAAILAGRSEAERVRLARRLGWNTVPSLAYSSKANAGMVDLSGVGRGHGLGLCQRGAAGMAREGKDFQTILEHYFPNTTLESVAN